MNGSSESVCVRLGREIWRGSSLWSDELEFASGLNVSQMHCLALRRCLFVLLPSLFQWHMSNMCWKVILDFIPGAAHISLGCGIVIKLLPVQNEGRRVTLLLVILHFHKPTKALYLMSRSSTETFLSVLLMFLSLFSAVDQRLRKCKLLNLEQMSISSSFQPVLIMCVCVSHSVMSDSLQPHGQQPSSLLCPWAFSGKNTGGSCHFLFHVLVICNP